MLKKKNIRRGFAPSASHLVLAAAAGILGVWSLCSPYTAAAVLVFFLWAAIGVFVLLLLKAGWRRKERRSLCWGGGGVLAAGGLLLAWFVRLDRLAGMGAGIFLFAFALSAGREFFRDGSTLEKKCCEAAFFACCGIAALFAFEGFSGRSETAARCCGILFVAAALEGLARFIESFTTEKKNVEDRIRL